MIRDILVPYGIQECLMFTFNVLRIGGQVVNAGGCTVCEFCDPSGHERIYVERDRPDRNRFVAVRSQG